MSLPCSTGGTAPFLQTAGARSVTDSHTPTHPAGPVAAAAAAAAILAAAPVATAAAAIMCGRRDDDNAAVGVGVGQRREEGGTSVEAGQALGARPRTAGGLIGVDLLSLTVPSHLVQGQYGGSVITLVDAQE